MRAAFVSLCVLVASAAAQEPASPARPRIGLVLSGGGARGAAHIGVLQVLEELHVPVDCIAGTSMGAIVGGLYAYGLSPARIEQVMTRQGMDRDWPHLLRDGEAFADWPLRRKEEAHTYLTRARLGFRDMSVRLPKGMVQGQNLETELRFLVVEAHDLHSFDDLPIPYRCTGVDVQTGDLVVLDRGNLAEAMRASMSLPGVFAPAVVAGHELIDGGIANNVPIDLARAMGADVLIVVDIGTPIDTEKAMASFVDVTRQMVAILTQQNVDRSLAQLRPDDLLIRPDLGDITSADFERAADAIAIGRTAGRAVAARLQRWALPPDEYARRRAAQQRTPRPPPVVREVALADESSLAAGILTDRLRVVAGEPLAETALRDGIERVYALDDFQRVRFAVTDWRDGAADVGVATELKGWGPSFLQFGLSLSSDFDNTAYQLAANMVLREVDPWGAEWRNVIEVGERMTLLSEFYQPIDGGPLFVAPRGALRRETVDLFVDGERVTERDLRAGQLGIDAGLELGMPGELRVGYQRTTGETEVGLSSVPATDTEFDDGFVRALLRIDTLDAPYFPEHGWAGVAEYRIGTEGLGADSDYDSVTAKAALAMTFGRWSITPVVEWDATLSGVRPTIAEATLGGFMRLTGLPKDSLRGQNAALAAVQVRTLLGSGIVPLYAGGSAELGNVWQDRGDKFHDLIASGSIFLAADVALGPLYLGLGMADGEAVTGFLFLGSTIVQ